MKNSDEVEKITRKVRRRFLYTGVTLLFYFSFVLGYTDWGQPLHRGINGSPISWALAQFIFLILLFIALEVLFIRSSREDSRHGEQK